MFTVNLNNKKRVAQQIHRIILLHSGLVTSRFYSPKTKTDLVFIIVFGPGGRVHGPQNQLFVTLDPPKYFRQYERKYQHIFETYYLWKLSDLGNCER